MYLYTLILLSHSPLTPYWQLHSYVLVDPEVSLLLSCLTSLLFFPYAMPSISSNPYSNTAMPCHSNPFMIHPPVIHYSSVLVLFLSHFFHPSSSILNCLFPLMLYPSLRSFIDQFPPHLLLHNLSFVRPLPGSYAHISSTISSPSTYVR